MVVRSVAIIPNESKPSGRSTISRTSVTPRRAEPGGSAPSPLVDSSPVGVKPLGSLTLSLDEYPPCSEPTLRQEALENSVTLKYSVTLHDPEAEWAAREMAARAKGCCGPCAVM